jgi:hypothetical protein
MKLVLSREDDSMGQRLIITVQVEEQDIAKLYYHWGAYTVDALYQVKRIINSLAHQGELSKDELILHLIHFVESEGGGIYGGSGSYEWNYVVKKFPNQVFKSKDIDRNNGLIAISERGMNELQYYSEGDVVIDYDGQAVANNVFFCYENVNEYEQYWTDYHCADCCPTPFEVDTNIEHFDFCDINPVIEIVENAGHVLSYEGAVYEMIE